MASPVPASYRACYVNFAEHLQNAWNPNVLYPGKANEWSPGDWRAFFAMLKAFGYNYFEFWISPAMSHREVVERPGPAAVFGRVVQAAIRTAHDVGLKVKFLIAPNVIGADWYYACPNVPADRELILRNWRHWLRTFGEADLVGIFPGDVGGCNRNGCTYETFIELALELTAETRAAMPHAAIELGTWGTPYSGWDEDMRPIPGWDGSFKMLIDPAYATPDFPCHIWNGGVARAARAMEYTLRRLPAFPAETQVAINLGFSTDGDATLGGDARPWARELAKVRPIVTWDYSLAEGENVCYPHWRLPRLAARRREERAAAPYSGGMVYTMTPRLALLSLYAGGRLWHEPDADPDGLARDFGRLVFGDERIGELMEAFEVLPGWGHYPRRRYSAEAARLAYDELLARLRAAKPAGGLPLCVDPEAYRRDLVWFAEQFRAQTLPDVDRDAVRQAYMDRAYAIYKEIPPPVDVRPDYAAGRFSSLFSAPEGLPSF